jgi:protein-S-isoprenylcysteine O-methyltransferase Ste14
MVMVALAYIWLKRSIVGPDPHLYDPVLLIMFLTQHAALLVVVFRFFSRVRIERPPSTRKPSPRLVFLLLVVWLVVGATVTAVSIGPFAVLPLSRREGLTIAACAGLGTLSLLAVLILTVREKQKNAGVGARHDQ